MKRTVEEILAIIETEIDTNKALYENATKSRNEAIYGDGTHETILHWSAMQMAYRERLDALFTLRDHIENGEYTLKEDQTK